MRRDAECRLECACQSIAIHAADRSQIIEPDIVIKVVVEIVARPLCHQGQARVECVMRAPMQMRCQLGEERIECRLTDDAQFGLLQDRIGATDGLTPAHYRKRCSNLPDA